MDPLSGAAATLMQRQHHSEDTLATLLATATIAGAPNVPRGILDRKNDFERAFNELASHLWTGALVFRENSSIQRTIVDRPERLHADFVLSRAELRNDGRR